MISRTAPLLHIKYVSSGPTGAAVVIGSGRLKPVVGIIGASVGSAVVTIPSSISANSVVGLAAVVNSSNEISSVVTSGNIIGVVGNAPKPKMHVNNYERNYTYKIMPQDICRKIYVEFNAIAIRYYCHGRLSASYST